MEIRENIAQYMSDTKAWLESVRDLSPEEMDAFFVARVEGYDQHMLSHWQGAYREFAELLPKTAENVLDLGAGTGIELEYIFELKPELRVTAVDLSRAMLNELPKKFPDKALTAVCQDYFKYDMGENCFDAVISFESFHHFLQDGKLKLYKKIYDCLTPGGEFILGDYIACCDEEEDMLREAYLEKRARFSVPEGQFIHFDIPLTLEHETEIMKLAGFREIWVPGTVNGATFIAAKK